MRRTLGLTLALAWAGCLPAQAATQPASQPCQYQIVRPDTSQAASRFRAWLKPQAEDLFGGDQPLANGDVYVADLDNDGKNETLFAWQEGSGSYLNVLLYRQAAGTWSLVKDLPFDDQLQLAHQYSGPLMKEPQLIARLCGKTIINLSGGLEPNYYPESLIWEGGKVRPVCSAPWLARHRAAAADLVKADMLDEARVLLNGVQQGCEKESPADVRAIKEDVARIARTTAAASAATYDFSWLMNEVKKNPDGQIVLDPRFGAMLVRIIPDAQLELVSLRGALKKSVWLPDDSKIIDGRYVLISGCEPHNCENRGLVWIDTATKQAIAMTGGVLTSKTTDPSKIPTAFWEQTLEAVGDWPDEGIDFIGADGKTTAVKKP